MSLPRRIIPDLTPQAAVAGPVGLFVDMPATETARRIGIKVRRPIDSVENNELMAIGALRDGLPVGACGDHVSTGEYKRIIRQRDFRRRLRVWRRG